MAKALVHGQWTHDYPLTPRKLKELGIPVKIGIPTEVYQLMDLYPQPPQTRPSVEFVPSPYIPPRPQGNRRVGDQLGLGQDRSLPLTSESLSLVY